MRRSRLKCKDMVEIVTAYLDDALDADTRRRFEAHLSGCDGCDNYLEQMRVTLATLGRIRDEDLDPVYRSRLLDAFKNFQ
jgi:anti-sigma factor RsiW